VADRVERLTELLMLLLDTPRSVTFEQIVSGSSLYPDRGESSRKSFERDKSSLRSMGIEIRTEIEEGDRGATRYTIDPDDYFLGDLELTDDERLALQLGAAMVQLDSSWDDDALLKIGHSGRPPAEAVVAEVPSLMQLPPLHQAMRNRCHAEFGYNGRARSVVARGLFYREGNWYLSALDDDDEKVFRVDRIDGDVVVGDPHGNDDAPEFDAAAAMPTDPLLIGEGDEVTATVEIDHVMAPRVERQRGGVVERRDDGSIVIAVGVRNHDAFRSWVLGLRDHARVLGPPDLVDEFVGWLTSIAEAR
jgi:predicted DNA-binding transcriptional regulator YafY